MKNALILLGCLLACANAVASEKKSLVAPPPGFRQSFAKQVVVRTNAPVITTQTTAPGQAGYVHYFLITAPDGGTETQVGIELADQRIAWSVPELGVVVSPFIKSGPHAVNGKIYEVQHLYGIRPFPDDESMLALQKELPYRVIPWVEDQTPYCYVKPPDGEMCLSCLGFVVRVLFPGPTPEYPKLPNDFRRMGSDIYYTTEDLLLYLAGLHGVPTLADRLQRIDNLAIPESLREELIALAGLMNTNNVGTGAPGASTANAPAPRSVAGKSRLRGQSISRARQPTPQPNKNL
jgi:hypothetical protein